jgi:catechol 2,3-dioxygenase-like lactoylglutathione lyase family enzyme
MFADRTITAMVPAKDYARARRWYEEKLGLVPDNEMEGGAGYELADGSRFFLYETQFAGTAKHTVVSFDTRDIANDMKHLRGRGVSFEEYDLPGLKTTDGVAEFGPVKNAWFKDSEGNIIGLVQGM